MTSSDMTFVKIRDLFAKGTDYTHSPFFKIKSIAKKTDMYINFY